MNQEDKWRQESHESMSKRITEHHEAKDFIGYHAWAPIDAQNAYYEGYVAARKKAQEEIEQLKMNLTPISVNDAYLVQNEELEKRDRLLGEAKEIIKLANYNYHFSKDHIYEIEKRSTNEWLKQYEEMRLK